MKTVMYLSDLSCRHIYLGNILIVIFLLFSCVDSERNSNVDRSSAVLTENGKDKKQINYDSLVILGVAEAELNARILADEFPVSKYFLQHRITNKLLKHYIAEFDKKYNGGERGIHINCSRVGDLKVYSISYLTHSTYDVAPMIRCEPINGRDVTMFFIDFADDIELPAAKAIKLNQDAISKDQYSDSKNALSSYSVVDDKFGGPNCIEVISDKISIELTFDKYHKLLKIDTLGVFK